MNEDLERYLNDHLAGSAGAVDLIDHLVSCQGDTGDGEFFRILKARVEADREQLREVMRRAGVKESAVLQAAGKLTAGASRLKLKWEGMEAGGLGMLEALEVLALGIEGKRRLWVLLGEIAPEYPEWLGVSFAELEIDAIGQGDAVEARRLGCGREALVDRKGRAARVG